MSDRLDELRHQRALAQEQLAWLDREIARESGGREPAPALPPAAPAASPAGTEGVPTPRPAPAGPRKAEVDADAIIAQYRTQGRSVQDEVKRGCLIYFFAAMTLLVLGLAALMLWKYR